MRRPMLLLAAASLAAGCTDFATPAELTKPTILAVVAEPPVVAPGGAVELATIVAGPDGPIEPDAVEWRLVETYPGVPPFGALEVAGATATFVAPDPVPPQPDGVPPLASVEATVVEGDTRITAIKGVVVLDLPEPATNPTITAVTIDGEPAADGVAIAAGAAVELAVEVDPAPGEDATFAWYATVGGIERYQSTPTELVAADAPRDGWIFVVVRDGRGGVAVRGVAVTVE